jgi:hypothetical protein
VAGWATGSAVGLAVACRLQLLYSSDLSAATTQKPNTSCCGNARAPSPSASPEGMRRSSAFALVACACARAATTLEVRLEGGHLVVAHKDVVYEVAPSRDVYSCSWADLSPIRGRATIDQIEPAIEPASMLPFYHHITLYMCNSDVHADRAHAHGELFDCLERPTISGCERQLFSWGAGAERFEMPPGTGFNLPRLAILQARAVHPCFELFFGFWPALLTLNTLAPGPRQASFAPRRAD